YKRKEEVILILRKVYPALANYLQFNREYEVADFTDIHTDYFEKYRWYKATNNLPEEFLETVKSIAREQGTSVYALEARNSVVNQEYDQESFILFVDGMGAEYIDYLAYVLDNIPKDKYTIKYRVGYCNLPSTTENNKDFLQGKDVFEEIIILDELKHGRNQYPDSIIQEMGILDSLREKIENALDNGKRKIILTSDHGTSRLAVLIRKTDFDRKLPAQGHSIYKHGRYCEGIDFGVDLPTAIVCDNKLIFADYSRFEQKGTPIDEIHGGASMEEWLVPVITIERVIAKPKGKVIVNEIVLETKEARIDSFTKMVTVEFRLAIPCTDVVSARIKNKQSECIKSDDRYVLKYRPAEGESTVTATIFADKGTIGKITFTIKRPLAMNKKFEI
ncbi:MAG TPA: BREX-4 system phosphatase PglZ, partial [Thermotogota bacterium]|nr:BREX-4 system phosphatase PglZ [Thermotogota bacterium]